MAPVRSPSWQWPPLRPKVVGLMGLLSLGLGLWQGNTAYLTQMGNGGIQVWDHPFVWELTGNVSAFLASYLPYAAIHNARRPEGHWSRFFLIHGLACLGFALICPPIFLALRHLWYGLMGWGHYDYGPLQWRLPMEWQKCAIGYLTLAGGFAFYFHVRDARLKTLREAELSARLQEARLQALSAQLDPHFLFNALNTISATMYESLERTDRLLSSLGQMLRDGLESQAALWPLSRELSHLEAFLDFAMTRFGDRLEIHRSISGGFGTILVPRFALQRLIENSLKHNLDGEGRKLSISILIESMDEFLDVQVLDDGVGFSSMPNGKGVGLANLRETLDLCYGKTAHLELGKGPSGGARVSLRIPVEGRHD